MKIIETLTDVEKLNALEGSTVGVFETMAYASDGYYDILSDICGGYYFARSGNKTVSPYYINIYSITKNLKDTNGMIGAIIRDKFRDKWNNIYNSLRSEYSPIEDYSRKEVKIFDNTYIKTDITDDDSNTTSTKNGNSSNIGDNNNTETVDYKNTEKTENATTTNSVWGFNSGSSVDADKSTDSYNIITERDGANNKTVTEEHSEDTVTNFENVYSETGRDIKRKESLTGKDTTDTTNSGRNTSAQKLIDEEINLRIKYIIADIIYKDIDSVLALPIYI